MPTFARIIEFDPADQRVADARPDHRAYTAELFERGAIRSSGPWASMDGALIVYEAADLAAAQQLVAADPYVERGVVREVSLREWNVVLPPPPA